MEGYINPIVIISTQTNSWIIYDNIINTDMACGAIAPNPFNYPSYIEFLGYNMSTWVMLKIFLSP